MRAYKFELSQLLSIQDTSNLLKDCKAFVEKLSSGELARLFVDVAFLGSALKFVKDEYWIKSKDSSDILFGRFIKKYFKLELTPVLFLHSFLEGSSLEGVTQAAKNAELIEKSVVHQIKSKSNIEKKIFATLTLQLMSELFEFEHQLNIQKEEDGSPISLSLYRTFDVIDQIFELHYLMDEELTSTTQKERLYEGAGMGVQSSYATTLMALKYANPSKGSRFIDLGSGYGRIGLVVGLMRPDIDFSGYEFVEGRVNIAEEASKNLELNQHVHFYTQDLSDKAFHIPVADTYYIFDSFSDESYQHIIPQLVEIAQNKKIIVITKGNARLWLQNKDWSKPQEFNGGNLCLFRSR